MTSVRLDHVSKRFGDTTALADIDLTIAAGELFFLLGPSGCGKSTLLRIIAGLQEPSGGRVWFNDQDVTRQPTQQRNAVMCFQSYALWPHMSVRDNIRFGLDIQRIDAAKQKSRVDEALRTVQMTEYADRKPNALSGGQQQRVALARALVVQPKCLLLDEPLSNLDAKLRLEMRGEIRRICRASGLTAIYVTHDQKEALSIADRLAILNKGNIEQVGRPQELYLRPNSRFTANFMGETNFLDGAIVERNGQNAVVETAIGRLTSNALPGNGQEPGALAVGAKVTVSLRPEAIRIGGDESSVNVFDAQIHDTIYLGEVAQHQVSLGGSSGTSRAGPDGSAGQTGDAAHVGGPGQHGGVGAEVNLKAFELNPRIVARDESRQRTRISFDPSDAVVLTS